MIRSEVLKKKIRESRSFREIVSLRDQVWSLSGKIDLTLFLDLRDRVEQKVKEIESPTFGDVQIEVLTSQDERKTIDQREVGIIVGKGLKLSDYVFREYPDALDFEIRPSSNVGPYDPALEDPGFKLEVNEPMNFRGGTIKESIIRIIKLALKLITFLICAYSRSFPHLQEDFDLIKVKLEQLFDKVSQAYY